MTKVVFFGASSVEGAGASDPSKRFTSVASRALGWDEVNLGIGGTTVVGRDAEGQIIDENSGVGRVTDVLDVHPDLVVISYGGNDFGQAKPLGAIEKFEQGTFLWDYDTMLRGLLHVLHPSQVVPCTVHFRSDAEIPNARGLTVPDYNRVIVQLGARHDLRVLDPYASVGINNDNWDDLSSDAIHLNDSGYERLAGFLIESFSPIGAGNQSHGDHGKSQTSS